MRHIACCKVCRLPNPCLTKASSAIKYCYVPIFSHDRLGTQAQTSELLLHLLCAFLGQRWTLQPDMHKQLLPDSLPFHLNTRVSHCKPRSQACIIHNCPTSRFHRVGSMLVGVHIVYKVELLHQVSQPCGCRSRSSCRKGERSWYQGRLAAPGTHPVCQAQGRQHSKRPRSHLQHLRPG